jgi:hypothetical protein
MHESKHFLPGQFVHSANILHKQFWTDIKENWRKNEKLTFKRRRFAVFWCAQNVVDDVGFPP